MKDVMVVLLVGVTLSLSVYLVALLTRGFWGLAAGLFALLALSYLMLLIARIRRQFRAHQSHENPQPHCPLCSYENREPTPSESYALSRGPAPPHLPLPPARADTDRTEPPTTTPSRGRTPGIGALSSFPTSTRRSSRHVDGAGTRTG